MATATDSVDLVGDAAVVNLVRAALFAALMGAFAFVSFPNPLNPAVPVTLQVLGVFLAGIFLGPLWGGFAMALYLLAGAVGAPVFAGGSAGIGVLLGPTGGYLISYPIAAAVIGAAVHGTEGLTQPETVSRSRFVGITAAGTAVIYALGILVYWQFLDVGLTEAVLGAAVVLVPIAAAAIGAAVHGTEGLAEPETIPLWRLVGAMVAGTAVIYALGILVYWQSLNVGLVEAVLGAAVVFVPVEALKIAAAVGIVRSDGITAA